VGAGHQIARLLNQIISQETPQQQVEDGRLSNVIVT